MPEDTGRSVILSRPSSPFMPTELRKRFWSDTMPRNPEMITMKDGHVLVSAPYSPGVMRNLIRESYGDPLDKHLVIEADRRLFRVPAMFAEGRMPQREATWNLGAVGVRGGNQATGKGARVAILDSGIDFDHPDFPRIQSVIRIVDDDAFDQSGHGTHCAGIIRGPMHPKHQQCPRYGIAPDASLIVVNVYDGDGAETSDWNLLRGIVSAAEKGADIISLSVGRVPTDLEPQFSVIFEMVARILLEWYDTIIVAAAGNESDRMEPFIGPIVHPADCPSILAVAAVNQDRQASRTSSGGIDGQRAPALAAPGVSIFSSFLTRNPGPDGPYTTLNGTSAATPHVAGVAALWVEKGYKGQKLWNQLITTAQPLTAENGPRDVGAGLVQAPE